MNHSGQASGFFMHSLQAFVRSCLLDDRFLIQKFAISSLPGAHQLMDLFMAVFVSSRVICGHSCWLVWMVFTSIWLIRSAFLLKFFSFSRILLQKSSTSSILGGVLMSMFFPQFSIECLCVLFKSFVMVEDL